MANSIGLTSSYTPRYNQVVVQKVLLKEIGGKKKFHYAGAIFNDRVRIGGDFPIFGEETEFRIVNVKRVIKDVNNKTLLLEDGKGRKFIIKFYPYCN